MVRNNGIPVPVVNQEKDYVDDIFGSTCLNGNNNYIKNDEHYDYPDYKRYVFTSLPNIDITVTDRMNITKVVRYKEKVAIHNSNISSKDKDVTGKVYVVDYITLTKSNVKSLDDSIVRLINNYSVKIDKANLDSLREFLTSSRHKQNDNLTLRFITVIDVNDISDNIMLYDKHTDLMFAVGAVKDVTVHPSNRQAESKVTQGTEVVIDIIDNNNPNKIYHVSIGSEVIPVLSRTDASKASSATLNIHSNGDNIRSEIVDLLSINDLGIFISKDEAKTNGDMSLLISDAKHNLEVAKIEWEREKLNIEKEMLDIKNAATIRANFQNRLSELLTHNSDRIKNTEDMFKSRLNMALLVIKSKQEAIAFEQKLKYEQARHKLDIDKHSYSNKGNGIIQALNIAKVASSTIL